MNTQTNTGTYQPFVHFRGPTKLVTPTFASGTTGTASAWYITETSAKIDVRSALFSDEVGNAKMIYNLRDLGMDKEDIAISQMSDDELIAEVMALAGIWADRDDLDDLLDRSDRIDELYAPYDSEDPHSVV